MDKKVIAFRMSNGDLELLNQIAQRDDISRSAALRVAIREATERRGILAPWLSIKRRSTKQDASTESGQ
jgi:hypothetical protein